MKKSRFWASYLILSLFLLAACQSETQEQPSDDVTEAAKKKTEASAGNSKRDLSHWAGDYRPVELVEGQGKKMGIRALAEGIFIEIVLVDQKAGCNKRFKMHATVSEEDVALSEGDCTLELRYKDGVIEVREVEACFSENAEVCTFSGKYQKL